MAYLPSIWSDPFRLVSTMGRLIDNAESHVEGENGFGHTDIYEKDGQLHYELELPGLKKEDIVARVEKSVLIVKGEMKRDETIKENSYLRRERRFGQFQKCFALPEYVDETENMQALFNDGILKISMPLRRSTRGEVVDIVID